MRSGIDRAYFMAQIIHMTAAYSNAVLVAALPYISDFAKKLNLPIEQPVATNQVKWSYDAPYRHYVFGTVILKNRDWFSVNHRGFIDGFRTATNFFADQELSDQSILKFFGKDNMTTNEVVSMARETMVKLGFPSALTHTADTPDVTGPFDLHALGRPEGHVPYCQVAWSWPQGEKNLRNLNTLTIQVNMETKQLVGYTFIPSVTNLMMTTPLTVDMPTELESDYRKRI
jgi:hypothetical protein